MHPCQNTIIPVKIASLMGETTPLATTERQFSGPRLTRAREWLGNLGNAVAPQDRATSLFQAPNFRYRINPKSKIQNRYDI